MFYTTNGLFVAFSRIVQYQTVVMLCITLSLYWCYKFYETNNRKYLYATFAAWCLGLLTHSDAMFIFFPVLSMLYAWSRKNNTGLKATVRMLLLPAVVTGTVLLGFYIPLVLSATSGTQEYWLGRFTGNITSGIISSTFLFVVYQPIYGLYIYLLLGSIGIGSWLLAVAAGRIKRLKRFETGANIWMYSGIVLWLVSALVFMEVLTRFPGTHIWTYIYPLCIFIGFGLANLDRLLPRKLYRILPYGCIAALFLFTAAQSYVIFVDHSKEYPWEKKNVLIWSLAVPKSNYQLSLFGFPYNRSYQAIADYIIADGKSSYYSTNDKVSISRYYIPLTKSNDKAGYFIQIRRPQTFTAYTMNKRGSSWMSKNPPIRVFYNEGREVAKVYLVPEAWGK
jgi:4-amino-4-deoxy-L-arabinose transferase-like glycosyltransferase